MDRVKIKNIASANLYLYDFILRAIYKKYNKKMEQLISKFAKIDSIEKFMSFRDEMKKIEEISLSGSITLKNSYSENTLYGYAAEVMNYGGIPETEIFYMPVMEHGIPYGRTMADGIYRFNNSFIFQGEYAKQQFNKESKKKAYYIGPYILYSRPYYSMEEYTDLKNKLGKTGLIFHRHSSETKVEENNISSMIDKCVHQYKGDIKTFLVCIYCQDALSIKESEITKYDHIRYVSAGFKIDPYFVRRLRSIIDLSDVVFYDSFSSSIGYAYYLGKEIVVTANDKDLENTIKTRGKAEWEKLKFLKEAYGCEKKHDRDKIKKFMEFYWGSAVIMTPEEIYHIYKENKENILKNRGF